MVLSRVHRELGVGAGGQRGQPAAGSARAGRQPKGAAQAAAHGGEPPSAQEEQEGRACAGDALPVM